jgi:CheY-like chemotaxis protein
VLIEDDDVDIELFSRLIATFDLPIRLAAFTDAKEALLMLRKEGQNKREYPYLIFLDLCLPGMTGFEFLDQLRGDVLLRRCVVFVISDASDDRTRKAAYERQVAGYLVKSQLNENWHRLSELLRGCLRSLF